MVKIKFLVLAAMAVMLTAGAGCQPWQKKYENCMAEKENLEALFESAQQSLEQCNADRNQLAQQLGMTEDELRKLQDKQSQQPSVGFEGEDARWDPRKGTITVTLESGVLFDSGKVTLKSAAKSRLNRIATEIKQRYVGKEVSVVGHTDTDPIRKTKWKDNWELSSQRALAVTRYLIARNIAAEQLAATGRGEFHPVGAKKAENRRVEIVVHVY